MNRLALQFTAPFSVSLIEEPLAPPADHQMMVRTEFSAISPGTELLIYRGEWPENLPVDDNIPALAGKFRFPLKYGYAAVGTVVKTGKQVPDHWCGTRVFSFHPHQSHFLTTPGEVIVVPDSLSAEAAAFLPNMETAVSFVMDGRPMIGEHVVLLGQGVVGLLTTTLLSAMPLASLVTLDRHPIRREKSLEKGAHESWDPLDPDVLDRMQRRFHLGAASGGADLVYELSGNPAALNQAIAVAGYSARVLVGSWYGAKRSDLDLGGTFHRGRIRLVSSQVSRLAPELTGLWTKSRRLSWALEMLKQSSPIDLITHRFPLSRAAEAYALLHEKPETAIQVVFTYEDIS